MLKFIRHTPKTFVANIEEPLYLVPILSDDLVIGSWKLKELFVKISPNQFEFYVELGCTVSSEQSHHSSVTNYFPFLLDPIWTLLIQGRGHFFLSPISLDATTDQV